MRIARSVALLFTTTMFSLAGSAFAQRAPTPIIRAHLSPAATASVGQRVQLQIEVLVPTWFTSPPELPPLDVENAFVTPLPTTERVTELVGTDTWAGTRFAYAITPQAAGTLKIPPVVLTFHYAIDARPSPPFSARTRPLELRARLPPGAEALTYFFAAPSLRLVERYEPHRPATLAVGEAFSRTLVLSVDNVDGLTMPPIEVAQPEGLRVSVDAPVITTTGEARSGTHVSRSEHATYVAERPGRYTLPAVTVAYWSTSANAVRRATLPAVTFDVAARQAFQQEIALPPEPVTAAPPPSRWAGVRQVVGEWWRTVLVAATAAGVLLLLGRRYLPRVLSRLGAARARRAHSEAHYFALVEGAARRGDLRATHAAALTWLAHFPPLQSSPTLSALAAASGDDGVRQRIAAVGAALYGRPGDTPQPPLASALVADLAAVRKLLSHDATGQREHRLAPLNPV